MYKRFDVWKEENNPKPIKHIVGVTRPPKNLEEAVKYRSSQNKVSLIVVVGERGDGKTNNAMVLAKQFFPEWNPNDHLFLRTEDVIEYMRKVGVSKKPVWIVFDEVGYNLDSYRWQDKMALIFKWLTETGRVSKINVIMTLPVLTGLNKATRRMIDFLVVCYRQGFGRVYIMDVDHYTGKDKRFKWLDVEFPHADKDTWLDYDKKKEKFWKELLNKHHEESKDKPTCSRCGGHSFAFRQKLGYSVCRKCGQIKEWDDGEKEE